MKPALFTRFLFITIACVTAGIFLIRFYTARTLLCHSCNVIIISADTLRADALPCLGYPMNTAPNICAFASKNILFTNNYANAPWTLPSYMSLFTSLYPASHQVDIPVIESLNPRVTTLPEQFHAAGYATYFISNGQPNVSPTLGFGRGFDSVYHSRIHGDTFTPLIALLPKLKQTVAGRAPSFIFYHTDVIHDYQENILTYPTSFPLDPHYVPPSLPRLTAFTQMTRQAAIDQLNGYIHEALPATAPIQKYTDWLEQLTNAPTLKEAEAVFTLLPEKDKSIIYTRQIDTILSIKGIDTVRLNRHIYDETISAFDRSFAQLLERIRSLGLEKNTIIVFMSPHGESFGEHNAFNHGSHLYDEVIRAPLIIHIPGVNPHTVTSLTQLIDLYPTLLSLVGIPYTGYVSGKNIFDLITGRPDADTNSFVLAQMDENYKFALRISRYKYIEQRSVPEKYELYDMQEDPGELKDRSAPKSHLTKFFREKLRNTLNALPVFPPTVSAFPDWIDDEHRKHLIETGYF